MSGILNSSRKEKESGFCGAKAIHVRGFPFSNTAAKFWTCLFDEVAADYPEQSRIELSALSGGLLVPDLLTPETGLQRDMDQLGSDAVRNAFDDAMTALSIIGPPPGVCLRVVPPPEQGVSQEFALDYLDDEILPFLLVWLLEWANVPDMLWNEPSVRGGIDAEDRDRGLRYLVAFDLKAQHLSEGLYRRDVAVSFKRDAVE